MSFTTIYNSETHFIETIVQGNLALNEAKEIISKIIQVAKENGCFLCLSDYREAEIKLSTFEIYAVPKIISDISASQGIPADKFKRALIVKKDLENFYFLETVTLNSGQNAKLFQDIDEAKKWLSEK
jgi:hypothetical protein